MLSIVVSLDAHIHRSLPLVTFPRRGCPRTALSASLHDGKWPSRIIPLAVVTCGDLPLLGGCQRQASVNGSLLVELALKELLAGGRSRT